MRSHLDRARQQARHAMEASSSGSNSSRRQPPPCTRQYEEIFGTREQREEEMEETAASEHAVLLKTCVPSVHGFNAQLAHLERKLQQAIEKPDHKLNEKRPKSSAVALPVLVRSPIAHLQQHCRHRGCSMPGNRDQLPTNCSPGCSNSITFRLLHESLWRGTPKQCCRTSALPSGARIPTSRSSSMAS